MFRCTLHTVICQVFLPNTDLHAIIISSNYPYLLIIMVCTWYCFKYYYHPLYTKTCSPSLPLFYEQTHPSAMNATMTGTAASVRSEQQQVTCLLY